ncbi:phosphoribosylanthranilate isomerase [Desulfovibrio oxyclinae]|uniref:phosphoribosylanthranilate isomerase n=1 Tax=Desulfovibrio oxyclinae TaxID=63560 RepID=UPI0003776F26|nr:phosphoribosylanthranilate isomerase [Desulfovibrio oxyclinae]
MKLHGSRPRPLIKVCGMTRMEDVKLCTALGVDMVGFIFHPPSPRCAAPAFVRSVPEGFPAKVGVFVRQDAQEILDIMDECRLDMAQLHGDHDPKTCEAVGRDRVIKVLWPQRHDSATTLQDEVDRFSPHCKHLLFDAGKKGGGHGESFDFTKLQTLEIIKPWFLAGNIGSHNVQGALESGACGLDLNSSVESEPGIKDSKKIRDLFSRLREES